MRRPLLRGLLHLLTLVSLLLAVSTVILWARSSFVSDALAWARFHCDGLDYRRRSVVLLPGEGEKTPGRGRHGASFGLPSNRHNSAPDDAS
jgi:hypothetical protein